MGQPTPDELAIPPTAVRSTRKEKTDLVEALNHSVGTVLLLEQREDRPDGTLHFLVGIENDLVVVKYQTNWQWKTQLTFLRSVEFGAVEARANDVQFCLRECAFHAEDKAVVEVGRIVAAISVEHQSFGDSAQFQQSMPVLVRACQARRLQREDRTDLPHRHIAHKGLEVVAFGRQFSRLGKIPVEDSDLLRHPAKRLRLVRWIVLALCALLIESHLRHRRLTNVDAGVSHQMMIGNLRIKHDRLLPR